VLEVERILFLQYSVIYGRNIIIFQSGFIYIGKYMKRTAFHGEEKTAQKTKELSESVLRMQAETKLLAFTSYDIYT
jgi:hypothetical protein